MHSHSKSNNDYEALLAQALESDPVAFWKLMPYLDANANQEAEKLAESLEQMIVSNPKHSAAMTLLGKLYYEGWGVKKDHAQAFDFFRQASIHKNPQAMTYLALCYESGKGCAVDYTKTLKLLDDAVKLGHLSALYTRGCVDLYGRCGVTINYDAAIILIDRAMDGGYPEAMNERGYMHQEGLGGEISYIKAAELYNKARHAGHRAAILNLALMLKDHLENDSSYPSPDNLCMEFVSLLNERHEKNLSGFTSIIARTLLFKLLPLPSAEDEGYARFYTTAKIIRQNILLAHRFEIQGTREQGGVEYSVAGGFVEVMVPEMRQSFKDLSSTIDGETILNEFQNSAGLSDQDIFGVLGKVSDDIDRIVLDLDRNLIDQQSGRDELLMLAPNFQRPGSSMSHCFCFVFYNNLLMVTDRDKRDYQIEVFELRDNEYSVKSCKKEVAYAVAKHMYNYSPLNNPITNNYILSALKNVGLTKLCTVPSKPQYTTVCTWVTAKSILFSALYFRIYAAVKVSPEMKSLPDDELEARAHKLASVYARKLYHLWSEHDKFKFLLSYVTDKSDPDPVMLAYIYLKYQHRPGKKKYIQLIDGLKILNETHFSAAKEISYKIAKQRVELALKLDSPTLSKLFTEQDIMEISRRLGELYMVSGKAKIEEVYSKIFKFNVFPVKSAIKVLDEALTEAKNHITRRTALSENSLLSSSRHSRPEDDTAALVKVRRYDDK